MSIHIQGTWEYHYVIILYMMVFSFENGFICFLGWLSHFQTGSLAPSIRFTVPLAISLAYCWCLIVQKFRSPLEKKTKNCHSNFEIIKNTKIKKNWVWKSSKICKKTDEYEKVDCLENNHNFEKKLWILKTFINLKKLRGFEYLSYL